EEPGGRVRAHDRADTGVVSGFRPASARGTQPARRGLPRSRSRAPLIRVVDAQAFGRGREQAVVNAYRAVLAAPGARSFVTAAFVGRLSLPMLTLGCIVLVHSRTGSYALAGAGPAAAAGAFPAAPPAARPAARRG